MNEDASDLLLPHEVAHLADSQVIGNHSIRTPRHFETASRSPFVVIQDLYPEDQMSGQGSAGNVIAALCSFFIPGLGQLVQGRLGMAILQCWKPKLRQMSISRVRHRRPAAVIL
ncbi:MAG: hypothetical protein ACREN6_05465 [Gemmatimonadaceae bacterium]